MNEPSSHLDQPHVRRTHTLHSPLLSSSNCHSTVVNFPNAHHLARGSETDAMLGKLIGPFRICRLLDRGGMGSVYLATRDDQEVSMDVAIKFIRSDIQDDRVYRRFQNERQILANLTHPHISRLIDAGTTEWGQPFLIMDYIDGLPIDQFCNRHQLNMKDILHLFQKVCDTVAFAHRHLVIHRDLKPSNILVTDCGEPVLLDFGIAKIIERSHEDPLTCTGDFLMTPEYASPEQVLGETASPQSDQYNLAVVLYELLTKRLPYTLGNRAIASVSNAICHTSPLKPSQIIKNLAVSQVPVNFTASIHLANLDAVLLNALHKEPHQRYAGVAEFADDLGRLCQNQPVLVREGLKIFSLVKGLKHHRWILVFSALILCFLGFASFKFRDTQPGLQHSESQRTFEEQNTLQPEKESSPGLSDVEKQLEIQNDLRRERDLARKQWAQLRRDRDGLHQQLEELKTVSESAKDNLDSALVDKDLLETRLENLLQFSKATDLELAKVEEAKAKSEGKLNLLADLIVETDEPRTGTHDQWIEKVLSTAPNAGLNEHADLLKLAGVVSLRSGQLEKAQAYLEESFHLLSLFPSPTSKERAIVMLYLAQVFDVKAQWSMAEAHYFTALNFVDSSCFSAALRWQCLLKIATFYQRWNQPTAAFQFLEVALEVARSRWGTQDLRFSQTLETLATMYFEIGNKEKAIQMQQMALRVLQQIGCGEAEVAASINRLAHYCCGEEIEFQQDPLAGTILDLDESASASFFSTSLNALPAPSLRFPRIQDFGTFDQGSGPNHSTTPAIPTRNASDDHARPTSPRRRAQVSGHPSLVPRQRGNSRAPKSSTRRGGGRGN